MTRKEATVAAQELLARMKTKGWRICVWENQGWHYCIEAARGCITVNETGWQSQSGRFFCMLTDDPKYPHAGCIDWHTERIFSDPNKAVAHTFRLANVHTEKRLAHLAAVEKALKGK